MGVKKSYAEEAYESFRRALGWPAVLLGILISVGLWVLDPAAEVSVKYLVPIGVVAFILVVSSIDLSVRTFRMSAAGLPSVLAGLSPPANIESAAGILLLSATNELSHDALVSIYRKENDFEVLFGVGHVLTVQEDGKVQILVTDVERQHADEAKKIGQNDAGFLRNLIVKTAIPRSRLSADS